MSAPAADAWREEHCGRWTLELDGRLLAAVEQAAGGWVVRIEFHGRTVSVAALKDLDAAAARAFAERLAHVTAQLGPLLEASIAGDGRSLS